MALGERPSSHRTDGCGTLFIYAKLSLRTVTGRPVIHANSRSARLTRIARTIFGGGQLCLRRRRSFSSRCLNVHQRRDFDTSLLRQEDELLKHASNQHAAKSIMSTRKSKGSRDKERNSDPTAIEAWRAFCTPKNYAHIVGRRAGERTELSSVGRATVAAGTLVTPWNLTPTAPLFLPLQLPRTHRIIILRVLLGDLSQNDASKTSSKEVQNSLWGFIKILLGDLSQRSPRKHPSAAFSGVFLESTSTASTNLLRALLDARLSLFRILLHRCTRAFPFPPRQAPRFHSRSSREL